MKMKTKIVESCCDPVLVEPIDAAEAEELAAAFKLLADPVRLRMLSLIANAPGGSMCACDLPDAMDRSQPTISHHLSLLTDAGLLTREQRGKWAWFSVEPERVAVLRDSLSLT
ncbi:MAG: ArsR/SmtB family transcription factor [Acidimicrobiia bacterium]